MIKLHRNSLTDKENRYKEKAEKNPPKTQTKESMKENCNKRKVDTKISSNSLVVSPPFLSRWINHLPFFIVFLANLCYISLSASQTGNWQQPKL